jgi:hypothetical protein
MHATTSARVRDLSGRALNEAARRARMFVACLLSDLRGESDHYFFAHARESSKISDGAREKARTSLIKLITVEL